MSCKDNFDSKQAPPQFSEEFKEKVLKRGLELRNWSAVCKEYDVPRKTLFRWRHNYTNLLEQLAFEMGVNVYYNPQIEFQADKSVSCIALRVSHTHPICYTQSVLTYDSLIHLSCLLFSTPIAATPKYALQRYSDQSDIIYANPNTSRISCFG